MGEAGTSGTRVLRVAVRSPHVVVARGLEALLRQHPDRFCVVAAPDGPDRPDPDVVLFDVIDLVDGESDLLQYLVGRTHAKVLAVGRDLRPDLLARALRAGADGSFSLGVTEAELLAAVGSAGTEWEPGDPGADPTVGSSSSAAGSARLGTDVGLTVREADTISLVAAGLSNDEIAAQQFVSVNTVKTNIRTAYRKMGVETRAQAAVWAVEHGYKLEDA